jgi:hypothetical protein
VEATVDYVLSGTAQVDFDRTKQSQTTTLNRSKSSRIKLPNENELEDGVDDLRKSLILTKFEEGEDDTGVFHRPMLPKEMRMKKVKGQKETRYRDGQVVYVKPGEKYISETATTTTKE